MTTGTGCMTIYLREPRDYYPSNYLSTLARSTSSEVTGQCLYLSKRTASECRSWFDGNIVWTEGHAYSSMNHSSNQHSRYRRFPSPLYTAYFSSIISWPVRAAKGLHLYWSTYPSLVDFSQWLSYLAQSMILVVVSTRAVNFSPLKIRRRGRGSYVWTFLCELPVIIIPVVPFGTIKSLKYCAYLAEYFSSFTYSV